MTVAVVVGILVLHNLLTNLWFTDRWTYVPVNLAVAFRAVLPTLVSPVAAAGLFGLWHIAPAAKTLDVNGVRRHRVVAVAGAVAVTAGVGLVLWELRVATGGLAAPALVHTAANSGATVAAWVVLGRMSC